ncbi:MAG TPA: hypothetical protein VHS31_08675 [Tepidisphaeraceae bacterium]|nr:hypothetical protein [Tepidisphaeraceae bacterium]
MTPLYTYFLSTLTMLPALVVYVLALAAALIFWSRAPRASLLTLIGIGILLLLTLVQPALQQRIITTSRSSASSVGQTLQAMSLIFSLLRSAGMGVIICAVFIDRPKLAELRGFEPLPPPLPPTH